MITSRPLTTDDLTMLQKALDQDTFKHAEVKNYTMDGAFSAVYEDERGPVGVIRFTKTLRFIAVLCDNEDKLRNAGVIIQALTDAEAQAKANGFTDIIFNTDSPALARFCVHRLGYTENKGEYIKYV
jgi:hypothetical protein